MNPFDDLRNEIPLEEAASFFVGIKKFAEWTDPPDMTGELEGQFSVPVEQVLDKLKEVIAMKFRKMVAYYTYAQSFRDHGWRAIKIEFYEHAEDEQEDAEFYTKRAVALGGPVHMNEIEPPPPSNNPFGILKIMARAEQEAIAMQRELLELVGDENPMRVGIDEALHHDQHHLDEMWQIMTQEEHQSVERPEMSAMSMGGDEEPEEPEEEEDEDEEPEEAPIEEKAASMRMMRAKLAVAPTQFQAPVQQMGQGVVGMGGTQVMPGTAAVPKQGLMSRIGGMMPKSTLGKVGLGVAGLGALGGAGMLASHMMGGGQQKTAEEKKTKLTPEQRKDLMEKHRTAYTRGWMSGISGSKSEAMREKRRRGQRWGQVAGSLAGMGAGGAATRKLMKAGPIGTVSGAALGYLAGGRLGKEIGKERDIKKISAALRMSRALEKLADEASAAGDAQMSAPTPGQELQPQNYLQAEMLGQQAQDANESGYYRQQLQEQAQAMNSMAQQVQMAQQQLQGLQQQASEANMQVQQAAQSAQQAHDMATEQTMQAAKARIGAQQMRQQLLQIVSQDPQALGEQAMGPSPEEMALAQQQQEQAAMAQGATPEGAAAPQVAPGAAPQEGEPGMAAPASGPPGPEAQGAEGASQLKTGSMDSRLLGAAVGGGLGAGMSVIQGSRAPELRQRVSELQGQQDGGFGKAVQLAKAQAQSAYANAAEQHPTMSALKGGVLGAATGALVGPTLAQKAQQIRADLPDAARGMGRILGVR